MKPIHYRCAQFFSKKMKREFLNTSRDVTKSSQYSRPANSDRPHIRSKTKLKNLMHRTQEKGVELPYNGIKPTRRPNVKFISCH